MQKQGVVFDFNGTLFWDTELQNRSWDKFLDGYGFKLSEEEKLTWVHGINAMDTFEYLFKRPCSADEVFQLTEEKEVIYREMCMDQGMEWAPGALELIEFLKVNNVPIAIATASARNNLDFFVEQLDLHRYFDSKHIVYNDGTMRGKPNPDLFNRAIEKLEIPAGLVTVFEDSLAGVEAAKRSGAGKIYIVNGNRKFSHYNYPVITHFDQVNKMSFLDS